MKETLIARLEALLAENDFKQIRDEVGEIAKEYRKLLYNDRNAAQEAHKVAGKNPEEFVTPEKDELEIKFDLLFTAYNERKTLYQQQRAEADARRAETQKRRAEEDKQRMETQAEVLKEMTALVESGEQNNDAFIRFKDIQTKWKSIGRVSLENETAKKLHADFNHQLDMFRHNRKIALDLLELDYTKNLAVKEFLLAKMEKLAEMDNAAGDITVQMRQYQAEWNKTGPVGRNEREVINSRFKELADTIYSKIHEFYDGRREQLAHSVEAKQALIDKINAINEVALSPEQSEAMLKEVLALQEAWKSTGFSNKGEEYWHTFRTACDTFFENRKKQLKEGDKVREAYKLQKVALCEQAEALQHDTDWVHTSDTLIKLQKEWQTIGSAGRNDENRLWIRFREACDKFFAAKKEHFSRSDQNQDVNLAAKEALIAKITEHQFDNEDIEAGFDALKAFADEWTAIGLVPIKEKNRLYNAYKKALDAKYAEIKKMREESRVTRAPGTFRKNFDQVRQTYSSGNTDRVMNREEDKLRYQIEALEEEIARYENNLGFFASSKSGKNPLLKDVEEKINKLKKDIKDLRVRLKVLATPIVATPVAIAEVVETATDDVAETTVEVVETATDDVVETTVEVVETATDDVVETTAEVVETATDDVAETTAEVVETATDDVVETTVEVVETATDDVAETTVEVVETATDDVVENVVEA